MKKITGSKARSKSLLFAVLLSFSALGFTLSPVGAQASFDIGYSFDYSPLVSGAPDSLHVVIRNTGLELLRLPSVTVWFSWMRAGTNLSPEGNQAILDLQPGQEASYSFSLEVPEIVTGDYYMTVDVTYQGFQVPNWGALETETYVVPDVLVYGASPGAYAVLPINYDDGRIYSAIALITLVGWYLPRKLRFKARD